VIRAAGRAVVRPFVLLGHLLVTGFVVALALPLWFLPWRPAMALARGYGYLAAICWPPGLRIATINLTRAYGATKNRGEIRRLALASCASMTQSIAEKMQIVRRHGASDPLPGDICEFENPAALARFRTQGPRLFVQAHFGSWEVGGGVAFSLVGHRGAAVIRDLDNPFLNRLVARLRFHDPATHSFDKRGGARKALARLRAGDSIGMVMDEDAGSRGVLVDFFGRPASTSLLAARLALLAGVPIFVAACVRRPGQKFLYRLTLVEPPDPALPRKRAELLLTERIVSILEEWIRANPEQWRWMHWRWKTRPDGSRETYGLRDLRRCRNDIATTASADHASQLRVQRAIVKRRMP
jgi:KDO2-lipid IV(A) lauroyltransferase